MRKGPPGTTSLLQRRAAHQTFAVHSTYRLSAGRDATALRQPGWPPPQRKVFAGHNTSHLAASANPGLARAGRVTTGLVNYFMKDPLLAIANALDRSCRRRLHGAAREFPVYDYEHLGSTDAANIPPVNKGAAEVRRRLLKNFLRWLSLFF